MSEIVAGIEIPQSAAAVEAAGPARELTDPLLFHHSRRVFLFGMLWARALRLDPDPELLYLSALFHDAGLLTPFSEVEQRFELDGADHARKFLLEHGFGAAAADVVWTAIALHTTPGIPVRMAPEIAATKYGVETDVVGAGLDQLDPDQVAEIVAAHPRGDFKAEFPRTYFDGNKHRAATTIGTINADVVAHFLPGFEPVNTVEMITGSAWAS
jgi:hypothetical protein